MLGPGNYKLKFLARENESGRIGSFEEDLNLPKPQPDELELSPMLLSGQLQAIEVTQEVAEENAGVGSKTQILAAGIFRSENRSQRDSRLHNQAGVVRLLPGVRP